MDKKICKTCQHDENDHFKGVGCIHIMDGNTDSWCPCDEFVEAKKKEIKTDVECHNCSHSIDEHHMSNGFITGCHEMGCNCELLPSEIAIHAIDTALSDMAKDVVETIYVKGAAT